MAIISEDEARLAASIISTWCGHTECKDCFIQKGKRCNKAPANWDVPYIRSNDGQELAAVRKDDK